MMISTHKNDPNDRMAVRVIYSDQSYYLAAYLSGIRRPTFLYTL